MKEKLLKKIKLLPTDSGVYVMKNMNDEIIYVGKAKNLKNRVSQYFHSSQKLPKVEMMAQNIDDLEYYLTLTELDAFILEKNLIEKHQPYFNILLKDGKTYPYIKVHTKEKFPRFSVVRRVKNDGGKYFGPYFGNIDAYELLKTINYAYPIRLCNTDFSKQKSKKRECLSYSLGLCKGVCTGKISEEEYDNIIKEAMFFLSGNEEKMKKILTEKMQNASQTENFEVAISLREKIKMVEKLEEKTISDIAKDREIDVFSIVCDETDCAVNVISLRHGKILGVANFLLENKMADESETLENFIIQYYEKNLIPKEIVTAKKINNQIISELLKSKNQTKISQSQKGKLSLLVKMSQNNAKLYLSNFKSTGNKRQDFAQNSIKQLQKVLNLEFLPQRIECFDISHISGSDKTGSMVVFEGGEKSGKNYRIFKIKTVIGNDDFASLQEVLQRRVEEWEKQKDLSFSKKPDVIIVDGGKGQLSSVCEKLQSSSFKSVKIISLAKKEEWIYLPNQTQPIILEKSSPALRLLQKIRDESHRFAITFHRKLRSQRMTQMEILKIEGVGKVLQKRLYQKFKNADKIKQAPVEEIAKIEGISLEKAKKIKEFLKK